MSNKLTKAAGDVFKQNPMQLPLGSMRPGLNRIEIEAHLPAAADKSCDTLAAISARSASCCWTRRKSNCRRSRASRACQTSPSRRRAPSRTSDRRTGRRLPCRRPRVNRLARLLPSRPIIRHRRRRPSISVCAALRRRRVKARADRCARAALNAEQLSSVGLKNDDLYAAWREKIETPSPPAPEELSRSEMMARHRLSCCRRTSPRRATCRRRRAASPCGTACRHHGGSGRCANCEARHRACRSL